jgi:hypothetical protein
MSTLLVVRRFLADYTRNPVNLLVLVLIPTVFVVVAAGSLADAAKLLGASGGGPAVQIATAGWAAGFLAGIAMYFQTASARDADRRLVLSGLPTRRLVAARLTTGLILALLAGTAAVAALAMRTGVDDPGRVVAGTLMFAVIYLAIGGLVGALAPNPVNGTVVILFVWILDVFFGPAMGSLDRPATRVLPTHFVSLWMIDLPSRHGGRLGDLGWAMVWTLTALALAWAVVSVRARMARPPHARLLPGSWSGQLAAGLRAGWRESRRNPVLWALMVAVPAVFILLADAVTPDEPTQVTVMEAGRKVTEQISLVTIHGGTMAPIAIGSLSALAGLFLLLDARSGDARLVLAGFRAGALTAARLGTLGLAVAFVTAVSLAVTATVFDPERWWIYAAGNALVAATYALIGVVLGPLFGRVSGVIMAFLLPFLDIGIAGSPMLRPEPAAWARLLPSYGGVRVLLDGGLTAGFDQARALAIALAWLAGLLAITTIMFRRLARPAAR